MGELYDSLSALEARQQRRRGPLPPDDVDRLHDHLIWGAWIRAEGGLEALRARCVLQRSSSDDPLQLRSDEFAAYAARRRFISPARRKKLAERYPDVGVVIDWPIAALSLRQRSQSVMKEWRQRYLDHGIGLDGAYRFPGDPQYCTENRRPLWPEDCIGLYERGDAFGFLILACLFRWYHKRGNADRQWSTAQYLVKALPGMCRDSLVSPHFEDVILLTKRLLILLPDCSILTEIDEDVVRRQISAPQHEPCYKLRRASADAGHWIPEPADPIVPYTYSRCLSSSQAIVPFAGLSKPSM